jgi:hypothetical protein
MMRAHRATTSSHGTGHSSDACCMRTACGGSSSRTCLGELLGSIVKGLDIGKAECFNQDDKSLIIMADVVKHHRSAGAFNTKLKLQLLLEPLSYRVDLTRLVERSKDTRWQLGPICEWLDEGPAAGRRLLCVAGGAGEGKSTVAAAICAAIDPSLLEEHLGNRLHGRLCAYRDVAPPPGSEQPLRDTTAESTCSTSSSTMTSGGCASCAS